MDLIERAAQRIQERTAAAPDVAPAPPPRAPAYTHPQGADSEARGAASTNGAPLTIDFARAHGSGILTPDRERDQMIEEFRHIKRHVIATLASQETPNRNVVMVTSALPGEGKTHVSINLAISLALEHDWTSLLIDADVITPQVHRRLGLEDGTGLMDLLADPTIPADSAILNTNIDSLSIMAAGRGHASSTELLSSQRMHVLINELSRRYADRVVVIDTPPLLATTEPAVVARYAGQILVVVEAEKTRHSSIEAALNLVGYRDKVHLVLNKVRPQFGDSAFGPYYAYSGYYGYYGTSRPRKSGAVEAELESADTGSRLRMPWNRGGKA